MAKRAAAGIRGAGQECTLSSAAARWSTTKDPISRCCLMLQCISIETMTGKSEVRNAHSAMAFDTSSNRSLVQS
eukprot:7383368-Prymnesium_polylepis.1